MEDNKVIIKFPNPNAPGMSSDTEDYWLYVTHFKGDGAKEKAVQWLRHALGSALVDDEGRVNLLYKEE